MKKQRGQQGDNKNQKQDGQGQGKGPNRQQKKHDNWVGHHEQISKPDKHGGSGAGRQQGGSGAGREHS